MGFLSPPPTTSRLREPSGPSPHVNLFIPTTLDALPRPGPRNRGGLSQFPRLSLSVLTHPHTSRDLDPPTPQPPGLRSRLRRGLTVSPDPGRIGERPGTKGIDSIFPKPTIPETSTSLSFLFRLHSTGPFSSTPLRHPVSSGGALRLPLLPYLGRCVLGTV